ncbi:chemotaxis protein CheA [Fulvivirga sediminis]|uniref:Chemotaxis protein CheA n=1 Tax=Fulvivirga sediminis TaxID=2803949 RepID=A0A937K0R3_9BACT|nr:chemotaxis protein CheA [Fulvivirga sediminis]MBL3655872.1 chemotaxis protein CheA [Fulvivirga sediminis]
MSKHDEVFREEALEQLEIAEQALLSFERSFDLQDIEEAFRSLHTFKGAAHIFSFKELGDFAHLIEYVLDGIRNKVIHNEPGITTKTLNYLDHLRKMMNESDQFTKTKKHKQILEEVNEIANHVIKTLKQNNQEKEEALLEADIDQEDQENISTYYASLNPTEPIDSGSFHPIFQIFEELADKTTLEIVEERDKNNEALISRWDLYISGQITKEDISAEFLFIEDEVTTSIHKVANFDLFKEMGFDELLKVLKKIPSEQKLEEITQYVSSLKDTLDTEESKQNTDKKQKKNSSLRVSSEKIDDLMNLVSELVTDQASLHLLASQSNNSQLEALAENIHRHIQQLRDISFDMTLVPVERMTGKFHRMVRDCALAMDKEVDFIVKGEKTELDKTFIETLSDPIMHMLRNCVDHGIETPEERIEKGKPVKGTITFDAFYSGTKVQIDIIDDGKGLSIPAIKNKAIEKGLITAEEALTDQEVFQLIFIPGFSTAQNVTDVSGRGVGMDVVKKNIESIHGSIDIHSKEGQGTTFTIKVPLTLSIIDGLLVKADDTHFIVPLAMVHKCYEVPYNLLANNVSKWITVDNEPHPFINIRKEMTLNTTPVPIKGMGINIQGRERSIILIVDEIIGNYQTVLKPISDYYKDQDFISGATILGDGSIALVLDINKLIEQEKLTNMIDEQ